LGGRGRIVRAFVILFLFRFVLLTFCFVDCSLFIVDRWGMYYNQTKRDNQAQKRAINKNTKSTDTNANQIAKARNTIQKC